MNDMNGAQSNTEALMRRGSMEMQKARGEFDYGARNTILNPTRMVGGDRGDLGKFTKAENGGPILERLSERLQQLLAETGIATGRVEAFGNRILGVEPNVVQQPAGSAPRPDPATTEQQLSALLTALEVEAKRLMIAAYRIERIG